MEKGSIFSLLDLKFSKLFLYFVNRSMFSPHILIKIKSTKISFWSVYLQM